ncbi:MAG: hypothetical protein R3321_02350 [Nitrososphaeraceae archaeon]|nr:hypothetical protein [Nitrososphaeraceae archaeon]
MTFEKDIEPIIIKSFNDKNYMYYAMLNDILNVVNKYYIQIEKIDDKVEEYLSQLEEDYPDGFKHDYSEFDNMTRYKHIQGKMEGLRELKQELLK